MPLILDIIDNRYDYHDFGQCYVFKVCTHLVERNVFSNAKSLISFNQLISFQWQTYIMYKHKNKCMCE